MNPFVFGALAGIGVTILKQLIFDEEENDVNFDSKKSKNQKITELEEKDKDLIKKLKDPNLSPIMKKEYEIERCIIKIEIKNVQDSEKLLLDKLQNT